MCIISIRVRGYLLNYLLIELKENRYKITDKIYKLYVTNVDADSYQEKISKWVGSVIVPKVGDNIVLDIDDWGLKGNEYKVVRVVYPAFESGL